MFISNRSFVDFVSDDKYDTVKCCIHMGVDLHMYEEWSLRQCAAMGYVDIMKLLLEHGADPQKALDILWKDEEYEAIGQLVSAIALAGEEKR
jgi:hypothetical protein